MSYDQWVWAFVTAITTFAIVMYIIANNGDDDGAV